MKYMYGLHNIVDMFNNESTSLSYVDLIIQPYIFF